MKKYSLRDYFSYIFGNYFYFIDECEVNNEILEKPMDYTYDIRLIEAIIDKNYKFFLL